MMLSSDAGSYEAWLNSGGGADSKPAALGGVDPAVGVLDAGDLRVAELALRGSNECCRFSCIWSVDPDFRARYGLPLYSL